jgi:DNA repair photolyase
MFSSPTPGRGAAHNPPNRFIPLNYEPWPDYDASEDPAPRTQFFRDDSRSILASNDSPDIPFRFSLNPYRGCEHGCIYCYARPTHEYLSFSSGLDFETKIMVKEDAPQLLRQHFQSKKWEPQSVALGAVTDPYQPIERRIELTRRCLQVFAEFRNPVGIVTKNALVTRDIDILSELHRYQAAGVFLSVTTLDCELARTMEPRASTPAARLRAIRELADAGLRVGVMFAPVIPGLNDHEVHDVLQAAAAAGAQSAGYVVLRLPYEVAPLFSDWLERHYPDRKDKVLGRIKAMRGGQLNQSEFGTRMTGAGPWAETFRQLFQLSRTRVGLNQRLPSLSAAAFRRPGETQSLFAE